jgi:tetratricopeptide (TPR) repeat protein
MLETHPSAEDFAGFLRVTSRSAHHGRNTQVIRHLLSDCAVCRHQLKTLGWSEQRLTRLLQLTAEGERLETDAAPVYDYSRAFAAVDRAVSAFLTPEKPVAENTVAALLSELEGLTARERIQRAASVPFSTPGVVRALIERSHACRFQSTDDMLHFAHLARLAAEACLAEDAGGDMRLSDLRTRAWGQYGNALRVCCRPREAEDALATAEGHRQNGTGDPALRVWLFERRAALLTFQEHFAEAIEMCEEAGRVYQEIGEPHSLAMTLVHKAIASLHSGEAEKAVRALNQAIPLIDHAEDPHLLLAACHNLIRCYIDLDRPDQALALYSETRSLYKEIGDPLILLRATWQEGQLLRDLGHLHAAETALLRSRKGYQERSLAYEAALVSLDLAAVYVKLGQVDEVKRTVMATVPIFHALRVKLDTLAALLQLQQVADQEQRALELIRLLNARVASLPKNRPLN